jgi:uncharacterized membrane protein
MDEKEPAFERLKTITAVVYALQAAAYFTGLTALVGVIVNYVKLDDVRGIWLESHFRWQIAPSGLPCCGSFWARCRGSSSLA